MGTKTTKRTEVFGRLTTPRLVETYLWQIKTTIQELKIMKTTFENKVAVVTGGTSGIGKAAALALAAAGAKVVVAGRRENEGREVVEAIEKSGGKALFVKTDVSHEADVKALVEKTISTFGRLDFAFNNAGVEGPVGPNI